MASRISIFHLSFSHSDYHLADPLQLNRVKYVSRLRTCGGASLLLHHGPIIGAAFFFIPPYPGTANESIGFTPGERRLRRSKVSPGKLLDRAFANSGVSYKNFGLLCQGNLGHKIWGAVSITDNGMHF
jgi:hypothetical protein